MSQEQGPNIQMQFVRHGDPDRSMDIPVKDFPLLEESRNTITDLKQKLGIKSDTALGFSGDNKRSVETVDLLVSPEHDVDRLKNFFKVRLADNLLYKMDGNFKEFKDRLGLTDKDKKLFRVVVEKSDYFRFEQGLDFTAYSDMSSIVAAYILRYADILNKWSRVSDKYETDTMFRVFV